MELCPSKIIRMPSASQNESFHESFDNDDDKFAEIVGEFIERIGTEVSLYEMYGSSISENDFQLIEMQIKAERIENILKMCIKKVNLVIYLSSLIEYRKDALKLLFARKHAQRIEQFSRRCFNQLKFTPYTEFNSDLDECLDILGKYVTTPQKVICIGHSLMQIFNDLFDFNVLILDFREWTKYSRSLE